MILTNEQLNDVEKCSMNEKHCHDCSMAMHMWDTSHEIPKGTCDTGCLRAVFKTLKVVQMVLDVAGDSLDEMRGEKLCQH